MMKIFLIFFVSCFILSCETTKYCVSDFDSKIQDKRCDKFRKERLKKEKETGACDLKPGFTEGGLSNQNYLTWDKCLELIEEEDAKCRALPRGKPEDYEVLSGSITAGGAPDDLPSCDECKDCKRLKPQRK